MSEALDHSGRQPKFRRRAAARPDEVLDAALSLFAARGYAQTSVEAIARAAGLSKAAVYLYFPSKTALLAALVSRAVAPVAEMVLQGGTGEPWAVLEGLLRAAARRLAEPGVIAVPALVLREAAQVPQIAEVYRAEVLDRVLPALRQIIARGVASGQFRAVDPDLTVRSVVGPLVAHLLLAETFGVAPEGGLGLEALVDHHITFLRAGLQP